ncbi:hypothetical protein K502DRAFT_305032 [Neoconidiobolus thromboides FSU 785]|nr:hypothetical protein K502DRAFT_305032 [Neoconidiobolus thromboides FSU 785]
MDPLNTVFVEGTKEDQALEFATLIDQLKEVTEDSEISLTSTTKSLISSENWSEIYTKFAFETATLLNVESHNIVAAFNLLLSQIKLADNSILAELIQNVVNSLIESSHENGYSKLAMLEILYNSIEKNNTLRCTAFEGIIKLSAKHKIVKSLTPSLSSIKTWVHQWGIDATRSRAFYLLLSNTLKDFDYRKEAFEFLLCYLYTFETETEVTEEILKIGELGIVEALQIPEVLNFESLLLSQPIKKLNGSPLYQLAEIFLSKDVASYKEFISNHQDLVSTHQLDQDSLLNKIRVLTVASLGTQHLGQPIAYSKLADCMFIEKLEGYETEIEIYIIDVIRAGLIEAKLNQLEASVTITRSTYRQFEQDHWNKLLLELSNWKVSLEHVIKTVNNATSNINSTLNQRTLNEQTETNAVTESS